MLCVTVPRRNLEVNNASSKNKHAEMDTRTQVGETKRPLCVWLARALHHIGFHENARKERANRWKPQRAAATRPVSFYNQTLYARSANTVLRMKRHAASTPVMPVCLSLLLRWDTWSTTGCSVGWSKHLTSGENSELLCLQAVVDNTLNFMLLYASTFYSATRSSPLELLCYWLNYPTYL